MAKAKEESGKGKEKKAAKDSASKSETKATSKKKAEPAKKASPKESKKESKASKAAAEESKSAKSASAKSAPVPAKEAPAKAAKPEQEPKPEPEPEPKPAVSEEPVPEAPTAETESPKPEPSKPVGLPAAVASLATSFEGVELPATQGTFTVFGGPRDHSFKKDDKLGLPTGAHFQYEPVRNLNPKSFYCAMRWEYQQNHMSTEEGKRWWANRRLVVASAATGKAVVVKAVDSGPHEKSGFAIAISPGAAEALGVEPGQEVEVRFAEAGSLLGPVNE